MSQFITMPRGIRLSDLSTDMFKSNGQVQNWTGPAENYTNPYGMILPDNGNKIPETVSWDKSRHR